LLKKGAKVTNSGEMDHLLPQSVLRRFGQREFSIFNGDLWRLPPEAD
jgi:hypothetical protein